MECAQLEDKSITFLVDKGDIRASAYPRNIHLAASGWSGRQETVLHEIGDLMGLADTYSDNNALNRFQPDSVMQSATSLTLLGDDVNGIRSVLKVIETGDTSCEPGNSPWRADPSLGISSYQQQLPYCMPDAQAATDCTQYNRDGKTCQEVGFTEGQQGEPWGPGAGIFRCTNSCLAWVSN